MHLNSSEPSLGFHFYFQFISENPKNFFSTIIWIQTSSIKVGSDILGVEGYDIIQRQKEIGNCIIILLT